jgi:hypothetical protein
VRALRRGPKSVVAGAVSADVVAVEDMVNISGSEKADRSRSFTS